METRLLRYLLVVIVTAIPLISASENTSCIASCQRSSIAAQQRQPDPCCGCCPASQCHDNGMFATCCGQDESFCGCTVRSAICSGGIFNSPEVTIQPSQGTCYSREQGSCSYFPSSNLWIVCPNNTRGCVSISKTSTSASCCTSGETCNPVTGTCEDRFSAAQAPVNCFCPVAEDRCCNDLRTGSRCYNPSEYSCTTNDVGQHVLCPINYLSCADACYSPSQYVCRNGKMYPVGSSRSRRFCPTYSTWYIPGTQSPDPICNGIPYDSSTYDCTVNERGQQIKCLRGLISCGQACYPAQQFCCQRGVVRPISQCNTLNGLVGNRPRQLISMRCNGAPFDSAIYDCVLNEKGEELMCPSGNRACGRGCYSPSQYCCLNGAMRPINQCNPPSSSRNPPPSSQAQDPLPELPCIPPYGP
eukprot:TRINITY_DN19634_c0_g1_i1.p1 TRINITY_DN19634_c0_g1~~TRINITY_DN19634_c0_g1_i1.p1  ORF type:complete len:415 (-),score=24.74 TRINITY_DN19634_c0_g1_i1:271-1515(-)